MAKLTRAQIRAGFGGKGALARLRGTFRRKRTRKVKHNMARRTRRSRRTRRGKKGLNLATSLVGANAVFQIAEPLFRAGIVSAIQSGDMNAVASAVKTGGKEAVTLKNLGEAVVPALVLGLARKIARGLGVSSPKVAGVRAF